ARHFHRFALELEEVEQDEQQRRQEQDQRAPPRNRNVVAKPEILFEPDIDEAFATKEIEAKKEKARNEEQKKHYQREWKPHSPDVGARSAGRIGHVQFRISAP